MWMAFRFDLAAIFNRGRNGEVFSPSPLLERITADPVLAQTKLIAEPWDAGSLPGALQCAGSLGGME